MKPLVFRGAAAADGEEAYRWHESRRQASGEDFLSAVQVTLETIADAETWLPRVGWLRHGTLAPDERPR